MKPALQIHHLCFGFAPGEEVLHDVSFDVEKGSFLAIIGPNGSGKSTLLKLIVGELQPRRGSIQHSERVAYVPQIQAFDKNFPITVLEVVLGGCYQVKKSEKRKLALEALRDVGMLDHQNSLFGCLSGGQAQRVLIARALASKPTLLLLDEPTSHIDSETEIALVKTLQTHKNEMTILMVTHALQTVLSSVDGLLTLQGGVAYLRPKEVCEHFALGLYHEPLIDIDEEHFK